MSSNQQNRFRISFMISPPLRIISTGLSKTSICSYGYTAILTVISAVLFWLSTAHDEKEWAVASQITVISAFILFVPACKAVPKPYMKSSRPEHSGRLLYCDRTCCRWVRSHDIPSAAFQCRCLPACPAPSSRPASPQSPSPCRWPSCRRGASRWR